MRIEASGAVYNNTCVQDRTDGDDSDRLHQHHPDGLERWRGGLTQGHCHADIVRAAHGVQRQRVRRHRERIL